MKFFDLLLQNKIGQAAGKTFNEDLLDIVAVIATIFGSMVTLYAVYLAFAMATASDANKRAEAKKRVINSIAIILILVALVGLLKVMEVKTNSVSPSGYEILVTGGNGPNYTITLGLVDGNVDPSNLERAKAAADFQLLGTASGWSLSRSEEPGIWNLKYTPPATNPPATATVRVQCNNVGSGVQPAEVTYRK